MIAPQGSLALYLPDLLFEENPRIVNDEINSLMRKRLMTYHKDLHAHPVSNEESFERSPRVDQRKVSYYPSNQSQKFLK